MKRATAELAGLRKTSAAEPALQHGAATQHHDLVGQRQRLGVVVGDKDRRDRKLAQERSQLGAQLAAGLGVERGERLVEQEQVRSGGQCARQRDALLLAGA